MPGKPVRFGADFRVRGTTASARTLPVDEFPSTYRTYAHVGPVGVIANLLEARRLGQSRSGAHVALYAHGAGITRYAALLRWS